MNYAKIRDLALEAAKAQEAANEFEALAVKREREGRPLAAEAAKLSAESWRRAENSIAKLIDVEMLGEPTPDELLAFNAAVQAGKFTL